MKKAQELFNELGFKLHNFGEDFLLYQYKTDYDEVVIYFNFNNKTYHATWTRFVHRNDTDFVPMEKRPENTKHSCKYGHWQLENWHEIGIEEHSAIHQQMLELGWIK